MTTALFSSNAVMPLTESPFKLVKNKIPVIYKLTINPIKVLNPEDEFKKNDIRDLRADFCFDDIWQ